MGDRLRISMLYIGFSESVPQLVFKKGSLGKIFKKNWASEELVDKHRAIEYSQANRGTFAKSNKETLICDLTLL